MKMVFNPSYIYIYEVSPVNTRFSISPKPIPPFMVQKIVSRLWRQNDVFCNHEGEGDEMLFIQPPKVGLGAQLIALQRTDAWIPKKNPVVPVGKEKKYYFTVFSIVFSSVFASKNKNAHLGDTSWYFTYHASHDAFRICFNVSVILSRLFFSDKN